MKLLFAIKGLALASGGAERVFCTVISELANRGHDVVAVTFDGLGASSFYPIDGRVRRINLAIGDATRAAGISETLQRVSALRRVVKSENPQVAVGFMHSMFLPLTFALLNTQIPVVGSEHIVRDHYRTRPLQYFLLVAGSLFIARMTVLSEVIRDRYPWVVRRRMTAMPNPVESPAALIGDRTARSQHTLLSVGRLDLQKDHATLVRAFARIAPQQPNWCLRILGEGPQRPYIEQLIEQLGLSERIALPGITADICREYESANLFVLASRYESFGLATAEAMAHGLAVVGFADCPGTNELILSDETGILVSPGTDRAVNLGDALKSLMDDPLRRLKLGEAGRKFVVDRFSSRRVADMWERLLQSLCV
jgi:glycosyltransferase involved in cell wall biosynthesis